MKRPLLFIATLLIAFSALAFLPLTVSAASTDPADSSDYNCENVDVTNNCKALRTNTENPCTVDVSKCGTTYYINGFVNLLAAAVGIAVVISIIIGGIQYSSSAGDPQKATAAKARIRNAIIALVAFIFLYAFLNFVVLGGV